jgi:hypothetical protein
MKYEFLQRIKKAVEIISETDKGRVVSPKFAVCDGSKKRKRNAEGTQKILGKTRRPNA